MTPETLRNLQARRHREWREIAGPACLSSYDKVRKLEDGIPWRRFKRSLPWLVVALLLLGLLLWAGSAWAQERASSLSASSGTPHITHDSSAPCRVKRADLPARRGEVAVKPGRGGASGVVPSRGGFGATRPTKAKRRTASVLLSALAASHVQRVGAETQGRRATEGCIGSQGRRSDRASRAAVALSRPAHVARFAAEAGAAGPRPEWNQAERRAQGVTAGRDRQQSCYVSLDGVPAPGCPDERPATVREYLIVGLLLLGLIGGWIGLHQLMFPEPEDPGRVTPKRGWE